MPEQGKQLDSPPSEGTASTAVAAPRPQTAPQTNPAKSPPAQLPKWKVLLHNDDKNEMLFVIQSIVELTPLNRQDAMNRMLEAHDQGLALLLTTHKERAELYQEQFQSKGLTVTIEPEA
jgi:ATP-dependent Clp protease adaptor protein ClpS